MVMNENYPPAKPKITDARTAQGRGAPTLMITYECPKCKNIAKLNAYAGPPSCKGSTGNETEHLFSWMDPLGLVEP